MCVFKLQGIIDTYFCLQKKVLRFRRTAKFLRFCEKKRCSW